MRSHSLWLQQLLLWVNWYELWLIYHLCRQHGSDWRSQGNHWEIEEQPSLWPFFKLLRNICFSSVQFSSVAQSCLTLCSPMNCSTPGLPVHHQLPEFTQTHVHRVSDAISSSVVPFSSCPQSFPKSGSLPMSQLFASGGQSIGVSASTSVLPMNTQDWSPLGLTGWISLQSKELSRVFSNTIVQKHHFFCTQLSSQCNSHIHTWLMEKL